MPTRGDDELEEPDRAGPRWSRGGLRTEGHSEELILRKFGDVFGTTVCVLPYSLLNRTELASDGRQTRSVNDDVWPGDTKLDRKSVV